MSERKSELEREREVDQTRLQRKGGEGEEGGMEREDGEREERDRERKKEQDRERR